MDILMLIGLVLVGLALVAVEVYVVPGLNVVGILGILVLIFAIGMTAKVVEIGGEAAGSPLTALQLIVMAWGARGKTIGSGIRTMVDIRIYPSGRVNDKRWYVVVGVAGIAADCLAASMQVCTMADDALCVSGNSQGIGGMRVDITRRMRGIIRGSTWISVGTPCQGQGQEW
ncbi:MAG: hypothetical protein P8Y04_13820 [Desulfobulbaceae bacterium]